MADGGSPVASAGIRIASQKVAKIAYTLKDDGGEIVDSSVGRDPLVYIHGIGSLVTGLEKALDGRAAGDHIAVSINPAEGYGERDESLIRKIPIRKLPGGKAKVGARIRAETDAGPMLLLVMGVQGDYATVDPNHPLSGKTLHFEVDVIEVREATEDELKHGHVHGPGEHHNH
jgi:FKBP-type peptidyl-prolyl cis-trans isomerase SlyD